MPTQPNPSLLESIQTNPSWDDPYFVAGYLAEHYRRLVSQMLATPKNIETVSDRIAEKFVKQILADCVYLTERLHALMDGEQPATDEDIARRLALLDDNPVFKVE